MSKTPICPCCGAHGGQGHDIDCALTSYLQASGYLMATLESSALIGPATLVASTEKRMDAPTLLDVAAGHMRDRAATYDQPGGERSMGRTVEAFNIITGRGDANDGVIMAIAKLNVMLANMAQGNHLTFDGMVELLNGIRQRLVDAKPKPSRLTESEGWLLMQILKDVRDRQREKPHRDSVEDKIAYAALGGEARLAE